MALPSLGARRAQLDQVPPRCRGLRSRYGDDRGLVRRAAHRIAGANVTRQRAVPGRVWPRGCPACGQATPRSLNSAMATECGPTNWPLTPNGSSGSCARSAPSSRTTARSVPRRPSSPGTPSPGCGRTRSGPPTKGPRPRWETGRRSSRSTACWTVCAARTTLRSAGSLPCCRTGPRKSRMSPRQCRPARYPRRLDSPAMSGRPCRRPPTTPVTGSPFPTAGNGAPTGPTRIPTAWTATPSVSPGFTSWPVR